MFTLSFFTPQQLANIRIYEKPLVRAPELAFIYSKRLRAYICWSPLVGRAYLLNESEYKFVTSYKVLPDNAPLSYARSLLYVPERVVSSLYPRRFTLEFNPRHLTIFVTTKCNLRCKYCYGLGGWVEAPDVDVDVAKWLIDEFNFQDITFHGWGEPTLLWDTIVELTEYAKKKGIKRFGVGTNGVFPEKKRAEMVKYLAENKFSITLSFDPPPEVHDKQRVFPDGSGSSKHVIETMKELARIGYHRFVGVRATVTEGGVDKMLEGAMWLKSMGYNSLKYEPMWATGRALVLLKKMNDPYVTPPNMRKFADELIKTRLWAERNKMRVDSTLFPFYPPKSAFCAVCNVGGLVLHNNNLLGTCWEENWTPDWTPDTPFTLGRVKIQNDGSKVKMTLEIDYSKVFQLKQRSVHNLEGCLRCPVKWGCGGGCPKKAHSNYGDLMRSGEREDYCDTRRYILWRYLEEKFAEAIGRK